MIGNEANPLVDIPIVIIGLIAIASVVLLTSRYSTYWNRLERLYLKRDYIVEEDIGWQFYLEFKTPGVPGLLNSFRSLIGIGTNQTGLILRAVWPVRLFFGTLQVPWSDFSLTKTDSTQWMPFEIVFSKLPDVQVRISRDAGERLLALGASHLTLRVTPEG